MVGQVELQKKINNLLTRFSIIVGQQGSGKKKLINEVIAPHFTDRGFTMYVVDDVKMDTMRELIKSANKYRDFVFVIADADDMSIQAKNSLLKVVEECPNNNYFIMTLSDINNTLDTIKSRASIFHMENYTPDDIVEYLHTVVWGENKEKEFQEAEQIVKDICETPGEVNTLTGHGVLDFYSYVEKVVDNICSVSLANALKIGNEIKLKLDDDGYDLALFWKAFSKICLSKYDLMYARYAIITNAYIQDLRVRSVNKQMLFDTWLIRIRDQEN